MTLRNWILSFVVAVVVFPASLFAADVTWNLASGGSWDTTSNNWTGGSPDANKYVDVSTDSVTFDNVAGGTINIQTGGVTPFSTEVSATAGTYTFTNNDNINGVGGTGALTKLNGGTLTISGANTYSGGTIINGGTLLANNVSGSATGSGAVTLNSTGTLGGNGIVTGTVAVGGGNSISPGASAGTTGTLTTGAETWDGGAIYVWEINDVTSVPGTGWDFLNITGTLTINPTVTIDITSIGTVADWNPAQNMSFVIATASGGIPGFSAAAFTLADGNWNQASNPYYAQAGSHWSVWQSGNDVVLGYSTPEPSALALLALGGLTLLRRRR